MYCKYKAHIDLLLDALTIYDVRHIVACPGARNALIIEALYNRKSFTIHPLTDERSAGFIALGMALNQKHPVALCVTSGTALLNLLPAIAEAYYQQIPLIVISADRPAEWIDQNDGQTLHQTNALQPYVAFNASLPEETIQANWCVRLLHEGFLQLKQNLPIHFNLPISEPFFTLKAEEEKVDKSKFTTFNDLSTQSNIPLAQNAIIEQLIASLHTSSLLPILILGQCTDDLRKSLAYLEASHSILILPEIISNGGEVWKTCLLENKPELLNFKAFHSCIIIYVGGNFVGKNLKKHIRLNSHAIDNYIRIGTEKHIINTFGCKSITKITMESKVFLDSLMQHKLPYNKQVHNFKKFLFNEYSKKIKPFTPSFFSDWKAMQLISQFISEPSILHLANSNTIRLASFCFANHLQHLYFANRGVNGIEGSLSTAIGYNVLSQQNNYCLIGDLSFFYDNNALWNTLPKRNLKIIVFNNFGGQIFKTVPHFNTLASLSPYITAQHNTSAKALATTHGWNYQQASNEQELQSCLTMLDCFFEKPMLLEIFTNSKLNTKVMEEFKCLFKNVESFSH